MKDEENISKIQDIGNNNYLLNAYLHLIKIEFVHFFISLIEIIMNIMQEWIIFINKNSYKEKSKNNYNNTLFSNFRFILYFFSKKRIIKKAFFYFSFD